MTHETSGNWYPVFDIKRDLNKEKQDILDEIYSQSTSVWGGYNEENNKFVVDKMKRVEEINRILQAIQLGYYK